MPRRFWMLFKVGVLTGVAAAASPASAQQEGIPYIPLEPTTQIVGGAEFLLYTRDVNLQTPAPYINGPDSGLLDPGNAEFDPEAGYRAFLSYRRAGLRVDAIFTEVGSWKYNPTGTLTQGLAFDSGITGPWTGANFIDLTTAFLPMHNAAAGGMGGDADEFDGLSPNADFTDPLPTYEALYESELKTFELNALSDDQLATFQFGMGYRNLQLDEVAGASITGTLRSSDVAPLPAPTNDGISHAFLTGPGGMTLQSGTGDGFEDENGNPSALPDILTMQNFARTSNDLNGVQGVLERRVMYWHGWRIDGVLKAGVYHNRARGSVVDVYTGTDPGAGGDSSTYGRTLSDSQNTVSFVGSAGLDSTLPLSERWSLIGGYEVMFLTGVALAPDQNAGVSAGAYNINTDADVMVHGGRLGLQFTY